MRMNGAEDGGAALYGFAWLALCVLQWSVCGVRLARTCREQHVPVPPVLFPARIAERVRAGRS
jgi:hypothetical protein